MGREEGDSKNGFFVRFKNNVDAGISTGVNTIFGSSRAQTPSPSSSSRQQDDSSLSSPEPNMEEVAVMERVAVSSPGSASPAESKKSFEDHLSIGRIDAMTAVAVSSYSPLALRHLPQPIPNDLEPRMDSTVFTFEDAFEDLLIVSQGQPLPSIRDLYSQRVLLNNIFGSHPAGGEHPYFYLQRLRLRGLLQMPRPGPWNPSPFSMEIFNQALDRIDPDLRGHRLAFREGRHMIPVDFYQEMDLLIKELTRLVPFSDESLNRLAAEERWYHQKLLQEPQRRLPIHEDELFSTVESRFLERAKTWDVFSKYMREGRSDEFERHDAEGGPKKLRSEENQAVNKKEFVDSFGNLHSTVTAKIFDEDGNEIGRAVHTKIASVHEEPDRLEPAEPVDNEEGQKPRKVGWFWK
ncbi:Fc.00g006740.m01.CDS01 [Cosmosporella sp. VM-42]